MNVRFFSQAATLLAWLTLATQPAAATDAPAATQPATDPNAGYRLDAGPFKTASFDMELAAKAGGKKLPLKVRCPVDANAPLPVVVFSHGAGGDGNTFATLTDHWASYGYVVLLPTHSDSIRLRRGSGERVDLTDHRGVIGSVRPVARMADVKLILDSLGKIEAKCPALRDAGGKGKLDRDRMAVAGHSAGALTAQMAIGAKVRTLRNFRPTDMGDRRLKAAIVISGPGTANRMFTRQSWAELDKPMLTITGSLDSLTLTGATPDNRQDPFTYAKAGNKYLLFIQGATHCSYSGKLMTVFLRERPTTDIDMITGATASATLAFLDAYLLGRAEAKAYLASDKIKQFSRGQAELKKK